MNWRKQQLTLRQGGGTTNRLSREASELEDDLEEEWEEEEEEVDEYEEEPEEEQEEGELAEDEEWGRGRRGAG